MKAKTRDWICERMDTLVRSLWQAEMWMLDAGWATNPRRRYWSAEHSELGSLIMICNFEEVPCFLHEQMHKRLDRKL